VILELMLLSLPHVVTLAVPMALFAATLFVFAHFSQSRALVGLAAGGVHPWRLLAPVVIIGIGFSLLMVQFNDRLLAGANARFQDQLEAIARSRPSVHLREGVLNTVRPPDGSLHYVWVESIDPGSGELRGVTVVSVSRPNEPAFLSAPSATMELLRNGRDIVLRLTDGEIRSVFTDSAGTMRTMQFERHAIFFRNVGAELDMEFLGRERAEREMPLAELRARIRGGELAARDAAKPGDAVARYRGELHRRYATAYACLAFVLLAPPLGIRLAPLGIGAVINISVAVLFFFRVGIIVGDRLVDAGRVGPVVGSWATVAALLAVALPLLRYSDAYAVQQSGGPGQL
jgi:lipopolysaccharide export system permease protein